MEDGLAVEYLEEVRRRFGWLKEVADGAIDQVDDGEFFVKLDPEGNSMGLLMKHLAGNMCARWHNPFASDGEQGRDRDSEFLVEAEDTAATILERWETGWERLFDLLDSLSAKDLGRTVRVRGRPYSLMQATNHQLSHYAYHVGQIVFLAKHFRSSDWQWLTVPRGESKQFDAKMRTESSLDQLA